jgi:hypothetical protein
MEKAGIGWLQNSHIIVIPFLEEGRFRVKENFLKESEQGAVNRDRKKGPGEARSTQIIVPESAETISESPRLSSIVVDASGDHAGFPSVLLAAYRFGIAHRQFERSNDQVRSC